MFTFPRGQHSQPRWKRKCPIWWRKCKGLTLFVPLLCWDWFLSLLSSTERLCGTSRLTRHPHVHHQIHASPMQVYGACLLDGRFEASAGSRPTAPTATRGDPLSLQLDAERWRGFYSLLAKKGTNHLVLPGSGRCSGMWESSGTIGHPTFYVSRSPHRRLFQSHIEG